MKKYTPYFVGIIAIAIIIYDAVALIKGGTEASISHLMIVWSYEYPIFTFVMGVLAGHLFWRVRETKDLSKATKRE